MPGLGDLGDKEWQCMSRMSEGVKVDQDWHCPCDYAHWFCQSCGICIGQVLVKETANADKR